MVILDTNVLSELIKPTPDRQVLQWISGQMAASMFTTTINQAEMLYGVALLPSGKRKIALAEAVAGMFEEDFAGRVLTFDGAAARAFAHLAAERRQAGKPISQFDAQIAAIGFSRGAIVATRKVTDFSDCGVRIVNPWDY